jgi:membrane AbrB-like protein
MSANSDSPAPAWYRAASWPAPLQWAALLALSALISLMWRAAGLPAALLLGPMIGGIGFGVNGLRLVVPRWPYLGAQAVIGAMVSAGITATIIATFGHDALLFSVVMATTLLGAAALGWLISRSGLIPGATAVYGTSPGAASAMVMLGEAEGGDARLIAFMQYSRVLLVALAAALVARFWVGASGGAHAAGAPWLAPVHWGNLAAVLLLAALGQQAARLLRLQAWALLGPMLLLSALHAGGWLVIDLPGWLLAAAYALLGWHIGLGFSRDALLHAGRAVPVMASAALCLIGFCGLLAWCLMHLAHVDALTAYLATSPGGLDSVAIIAASTPGVDLPFVMALQSVRLLFCIGLSPLITRLVVRYSPHLQEAAN